MYHPKMQHTYVGVDSHKNSHTAVFLSCFYEKLGEITLSSVPSEFDDFVKRCEKYRMANTTFAFGFEDTSAYGRSLVQFLIKHNHLVKHVDASLVANERNSRNVLQKTDAIDAESAARVLLNRFDELPIANPCDKYWIISNLVARRNLMVKVNVMLKNQLHSLIPDHYPSYHSFFTTIDCNSSLAFYQTYPSPSCLTHVSVAELTTFFKDISKKRVGEKKAIQILNTVKKDGVDSFEHQEVRDFTIRSTVRQIQANLMEIDAIEAQLTSFLTHFNYPLTSMRGIDTVIAATLIAEIGEITRFPNPASLARYAGVAPVTHASGKTNVQYANKRGNRKLNEAFFRLALILIGSRKSVINPFFLNYYHKKIAEGKTKRQALKCIERRLVNIIWGIMARQEPYINPPMTATANHTPEIAITANTV